jgi:2-C-methyl-D-erythritol 2,4-cyclodiphosphate synthase
MRVGIGYDVHPLVPGRKLVLGGVEIPFAKGLSGHSDADVLTHAISDALLGAAGLRDIGIQFPSDDPAFKDISSLVLLGRVKTLVKTSNFRIGNIDAVIVAQQPKVAPYIEDMRGRISRTLEIDVRQVMVKATTTDGLGYAGRMEGIAAYAVALIDEEKQ